MIIQQQIYNKQLPVYSFLYEFCQLAQEHKKWPVDEMDYLGSRYSGKTRAVATFGNDMCNMYDKEGKPVQAGLVIYRKTSKGEDEVFQDYLQIFQSNIFGVAFKPYITSGKRKIVFSNGSAIYFKSLGVRKTEQSSSSGAGLHAIKGEYIILVFEECFEFTETEMSDIEKAVRGFNPEAKILKVKICNPYYPTLPFIKNFYKTQPVDLEAMRTKGYQMGIYDTIDGTTGIVRKKLLVQMNWRAVQNWREEPLINQVTGQPTGYNRYIAIPNTNGGPEMVIPQSKLDDLVEDYGRIDQDRAMVNDLGIAGNVSDNNIYYALWQHVQKPEWYPHEEWRCGIDVGAGMSGRSGATTVIWGGVTRGYHNDTYAEKYIDLQDKRSMTGHEIYEVILDWINEMREETYERTGKLIEFLQVKVDSSAIEFINYINTRAGEGDDFIQGRHYDWIEFVPCEIRTLKNTGTGLDNITGLRVPYERDNMSNGFIRVDKERCPHLDDEFCRSEWDSNKLTGKPKRKDDNDHVITAWEYANEEDMIYNTNNSL